MKKYLLFAIIVCCLKTVFAQNTGVVYYGEIQSMGLGAPVGADYNAFLIFDNQRSLYITRQDSIEGGHIFKQGNFGTGDKRVIKTVVTNPKGFRYYNNRVNQTFYSRDIGFKKVAETTPKIPWELSDETKKIGDITCYKATAPFRGRNYTAWYASNIALPYGPWKLQGLPGIILEAYDTDKEIYWYFKSIKYPSNQPHLLKPIDNENETWITINEFKSFMVQSYIKSITGGRILSESMDIDNIPNLKETLIDVNIEAFKVEN